jgi:hypothetical protein
VISVLLGACARLAPGEWAAAESDRAASRPRPDAMAPSRKGIVEMDAPTALDDEMAQKSEDPGRTVHSCLTSGCTSATLIMAGMANGLPAHDGTLPVPLIARSNDVLSAQTGAVKSALSVFARTRNCSILWKHGRVSGEQTSVRSMLLSTVGRKSCAVPATANTADVERALFKKLAACAAHSPAPQRTSRIAWEDNNEHDNPRQC